MGVSTRFRWDHPSGSNTKTTSFYSIFILQNYSLLFEAGSLDGKRKKNCLFKSGMTTPTVDTRRCVMQIRADLIELIILCRFVTNSLYSEPRPEDALLSLEMTT
ncbi:hypothetical protein Droror1_Dr00028262 [Drosera rotundifolia]